MSNFKFIDPNKLTKIANTAKQVEDLENKEEIEEIDTISNLFKTNEMQNILRKQLTKSYEKIITDSISLNDITNTPQISFFSSQPLSYKSTLLKYPKNNQLIDFILKNNKILFYEINILKNNKIFTYIYPSILFYSYISLDLNIKSINSYRFSLFVTEQTKKQYIYVSKRFFPNQVHFSNT